MRLCTYAITAFLYFSKEIVVYIFCHRLLRIRIKTWLQSCEKYLYWDEICVCLLNPNSRTILFLRRTRSARSMMTEIHFVITGTCLHPWRDWQYTDRFTQILPDRDSQTLNSPLAKMSMRFKIIRPVRKKNIFWTYNFCFIVLDLIWLIKSTCTLNYLQSTFSVNKIVLEILKIRCTLLINRYNRENQTVHLFSRSLYNTARNGPWTSSLLTDFHRTRKTGQLISRRPSER